MFFAGPGPGPGPKATEKPVEAKPDPYKALVDDAIRKGYKDPVHKALDRAFRFMAGLNVQNFLHRGEIRAFEGILPHADSMTKPKVQWDLIVGSSAAYRADNLLNRLDLIDRPVAVQRERQAIIWELRRASSFPFNPHQAALPSCTHRGYTPLKRRNSWNRCSPSSTPSTKRTTCSPPRSS